MNLRKRNVAVESDSAPAPQSKRAAPAPKKKSAKVENGKSSSRKKQQEVVESESEYFQEKNEKLSKKEPDVREEQHDEKRETKESIVEDLDDSDDDDELKEVKIKNSKKKSPLKGKAFHKKEVAHSDQNGAKSKAKKTKKDKKPLNQVTNAPILSVEDAIENMLKMEMMAPKSSNDNEEMMSDDDDDDESDDDCENDKSVNKTHDDDEFQEVEMVDHATLVPKITKESFEITVDNKKAKKPVDKAAQIERMRKAIMKKYRIIVHKLHLHCWLAHGFYLNRLALSDMIRAVVLSVQSLQLQFDFKLHELNRELLLDVLEKARAAFGLNADSKLDSQVVVTSDSLMRAVRDLQFDSYLEYLLVILVVLRNMNIKARLCVCFDVLSLKDEATSRALKTGNAQSKGSSKKQSKKTKSAKKEEDESTSSEEEVVETKKPKAAAKKAKAVAKPEPVVKSARSSSRAALQKLKESSDSEEVDSDERDFKAIKKRASLARAERSSKKIKKEDDDDEFKPEVKESLSDDEDEDDGPEEKPSVEPKVKEEVKEEEMDVDQDQNNNVVEVKQLNKPIIKNNKILSTDEDVSLNEQKSSQSRDRFYWLEVYLEEEKRWVSADPLKLIVDRPEHFEKRFGDQVLYVCAFDDDNRFKDVTRRYSSNFLTTGRFLQISHIDEKKNWWETILFKYLPLDAQMDMREEQDIKKTLLSRGLPSSLSEFKDHPLYVLRRHLLKFQSIYPQHPDPVGHFREDPVYSRDNQVTLHSRQTWLKYARVIKPGEDAYKIVKGRLKASEYKAGRRDNPDLELFGYWQTQQYDPPRAYGGKVPRNEFGNVELFLPNMLPKGCVHLRYPNLNRICRKLDIDCAAAVVGFDAHGGFSHAVCDGWVICEEFKETVVAAAEEEERRAQLKLIQMRQERILSNWQRLVKGMLIREKLRLKYDNYNGKGKGADSKDSAKAKQSSSTAEDKMEECSHEVQTTTVSDQAMPMQVDQLYDPVQVSAKLAKPKKAKQPPAKKQPAANSKKAPSKPATDSTKHYPKRKSRNKKPIVDEDDDEEVEVENDDDRDKTYFGAEGAEKQESEEEDDDDEDEEYESSSKRRRKPSKPKSKQAPPKRRRKFDFVVEDEDEPETKAKTESNAGAVSQQAPPQTNGHVNHDDDLNLSEEDD